MSERIMEQAMAHFLRFGFAKTRVEEIAADMGISKKTIYNHFKDKETLFDLTVAAYVRQNVEEVAKVAADASLDLMKRLETTLSLAMRKVGGKESPFFLDLKRRNAAFGTSTMAYLQAASFDIISRLVEEAKAAALMRTDLPTMNIAFVFLNILAGMASWEDDPARTLTRQRIFRDSLQTVLEGLLTAEGRGRLSDSIETGLKEVEP
ncbi:MAG: TetR/AcrR family transcriptional regulator [Spirochaetes bacterium]|nr:TetR/AcrR family transcriptional regulator [Spirochaetota bacterium]